MPSTSKVILMCGALSGGAIRRWFLALLAVALGAASANAQTFAYVTNFTENNVSVIDTSTHTVVGNPIPVGLNPTGVAVTPDGTRAYVANSHPTSNSVSVIDTATNTVVATVPVGSGPWGVAIAPNGTFAYVTNRTATPNGTVSVIDANPSSKTYHTVVATITVRSSPMGVAFTPDGTRAYVVNNGPANVSVIDTQTSTVIGLPINLNGVMGVGISIANTPNGIYAYVAGFHRVVVIDTFDNRVVTYINGSLINANSYGVAILPTGTLAYVTSQDFNNVRVINTRTNMVLPFPQSPITVGDGPYGIAINPTGTLAYTADFGSSSVSVINITTRDVETIPIAGNPFWVAVANIPPRTPADLAITKTAAPDAVMAGANITYTLRVTNNGPGAARSVTVTDILPDTTTFVSCESTACGFCGGEGRTRTVDFALLAPGESATITLVARVNDGLKEGTLISNTATVISSMTPDPNLDNNSSTATVTVSVPLPGAVGALVSKLRLWPTSQGR